MRNEVLKYHCLCLSQYILCQDEWKGVSILFHFTMGLLLWRRQATKNYGLLNIFHLFPRTPISGITVQVSRKFFRLYNMSLALKFHWAIHNKSCVKIVSTYFLKLITFTRKAGWILVMQNIILNFWRMLWRNVISLLIYLKFISTYFLKWIWSDKFTKKFEPQLKSIVSAVLEVIWLMDA